MDCPKVAIPPEIWTSLILPQDYRIPARLSCHAVVRETLKEADMTCRSFIRQNIAKLWILALSMLNEELQLRPILPGVLSCGEIGKTNCYASVIDSPV